MPFVFKTLFKVVFSVAVFGASLAQAAPNDYPAGPVKLVVPFTPGGTSDILARTLAEELTKALGQSVVVENRAGAGSALGTAYVARTGPDGYTLLMASSSGFAVNPHITPDLQYDPLKNFTPISLVAQIQNMLVVRSTLPVKSVPELIEYAKTHDLFFGSAGNGSSPHMSAEVFKAMTGVKMTHVPFKGGPQAMQELQAGRIDVMFENMPSAVVAVQGDRVRALAVTGAHAAPLAPGVPTIASTLPGYQVNVWYGLVAPTGTPAAIVERLSRETARILAMPAVRDKLVAAGTEPESMTPQAFKAFIGSEYDKWGSVISKAGIKAE
ncbi:tripartite tricarboxylate transporter substrate binding protein [soil metagenome]